MTVQSYRGHHGVTCDSCSESTEEFDSFDEAIQAIKDLGWKISREQGEWTHTCAGCLEKPQETSLQKAKRLLG